MSAYITMKMPLVDQQCLLRALEDLGFGEEKVEVHENPVKLSGYRGKKAHLVLPCRKISSLSNDVGFERTDQGYRLHVNDYDMRQFDEGWRNKLHERYREHYEKKKEAKERKQMEKERRKMLKAKREKIEEKAREKGYSVETTREDGKVKMVLNKRVY
jgi:hypothetical protein